MFVGFRVSLILPLAFLVGAFIFGTVVGSHETHCLAPPSPPTMPIPHFHP